jgi:hypothetical protein
MHSHLVFIWPILVIYCFVKFTTFFPTKYLVLFESFLLLTFTNTLTQSSKPSGIFLGPAGTVVKASVSQIVPVDLLPIQGKMAAFL